jgi:hypothetical protein
MRTEQLMYMHFETMLALGENPPSIDPSFHLHHSIFRAAASIQ